MMSIHPVERLGGQHAWSATGYPNGVIPCHVYPGMDSTLTSMLCALIVSASTGCAGSRAYNAGGAGTKFVQGCGTCLLNH